MFRRLHSKKRRLTLIRLGKKSFAGYAGSRLICGRRRARAALSSFLRYVVTPQMYYQSELKIVAVVPWFLAKLVSVFEDGVTSPHWPYLFGYVCLQFQKCSGGTSTLRDVRSTCLRLFHTPFISISSVGSLGSSDAIFQSQ